MQHDTLVGRKGAQCAHQSRLPKFLKLSLENWHTRLAA